MDDAIMTTSTEIIHSSLRVEYTFHFDRIVFKRPYLVVKHSIYDYIHFIIILL